MSNKIRSAVRATNAANKIAATRAKRARKKAAAEKPVVDKNNFASAIISAAFVADFLPLAASVANEAKGDVDEAKARAGCSLAPVVAALASDAIATRFGKAWSCPPAAPPFVGCC